MPENKVQITIEAVDKTKDAMSSAKSAVGLLQESWVAITAKVAAASAVVYTVTKTLSSFINEAAEAETIEKRLQFALETTGYSWQHAKSAVDEFASSIQESTRFSGEQARQSLTDMMMYTRDFSKAQMGAKLAMDMSIRTGQDLGSTNRLIGMAMSGNVEMLGRYIPELRDLDNVLGANATMAERAAYSFKILLEKFGGTAQADIETYAGKLSRFKNAWSDFKAMIGNEVLPPLKNVLDCLREIAQEMTKEPPPFKEVPIAKLWGMDLTRRVPYKGEELNELMLQRARVQAFQRQALAAQTKPDIFPEKQIDIVKEVQAAIEGVTAAEDLRGQIAIARSELAEKGWGKEKGLIDQVTDALTMMERVTNEWGEITVARQELVEAGWAATTKKEEEATQEGIANAKLLHQAWIEGYTKISDSERVITTVSENISSVWGDNMSKMLTDSKNAGEYIKKIWMGTADAIISSITKMMAQWLLFGSITGKKEEGGGALTGGLWSGIIGGIKGLFAEGGYVPGGFLPIKAFQGGGYANRPTLGLIGEGGEGEYIIPESKMGGQTIIVNNYNTKIEATDVDSFERRYGNSILKVTQDSLRQRGSMHRAIRRY